MAEQDAIITGVAAGIGHGLVLHFAGLGWRSCALGKETVVCSSFARIAK